MGEKSGGLTNMILIILALVALIIIVQTFFPEIAETITEKMRNVIDTTEGKIGTILPPSMYL